jgi:DNA-binding MarR family transcriptional regulator
MKNYTRVPNHIIDDSSIDTTSKMILIYIYRRKDLKGWTFSYTNIRKTLKIGQSTLKRHVKWLIDNNFLEHFQDNNKWILRLKDNE